MPGRHRRVITQGRVHQFPNAPNVIRDAKLHGGRDAQRFMDATEIIGHRIKRDRRFVIFELL